MNALVINDNEYQVPADINMDKWMDAAKVVGNPDSYISVLIDCPVEEVAIVPEDTKVLVMAFLYQLCFPSFSYKKSQAVDFNKLTFSDFIDCEVYIDRGLENHLKDIMSVIVKDYNDSLNISQVWSVYQSFLNWRNAFYYNYKNLFNLNVEREESEGKKESAAMVWYNVVMVVCEGDITKMDEVLEMPVSKVMNWLAWNKDQKIKQKQENDVQRNN